jgi:hypothetical protein
MHETNVGFIALPAASKAKASLHDFFSAIIKGMAAVMARQPMPLKTRES